MDLAPLLIVAGVIVLLLVAVGSLVRVITVREHERGLRYRSGRLTGIVGAGSHIAVRPWSEIIVLDTRPVSLAVEGQEVLTADGVSVKISLVARYEVGDPAAAVTRDADYRRTMYLLLQLALRDAVSRRTLDETLAARRDLGPEMRDACGGRLAELGVELLALDVRDVMLPGELRRAFSGVIAARKEGEAGLERARAETATLRGLANAGRMLDDNPGLLQLRILQQLGETPGATVVFGAPDASVPLKAPSRSGPMRARPAAPRDPEQR